MIRRMRKHWPEILIGGVFFAVLALSAVSFVRACGRISVKDRELASTYRYVGDVIW